MDAGAENDLRSSHASRFRVKEATIFRACGRAAEHADTQFRVSREIWLSFQVIRSTDYHRAKLNKRIPTRWGCTIRHICDVLFVSCMSVYGEGKPGQSSLFACPCKSGANGNHRRRVIVIPLNVFFRTWLRGTACRCIPAMYTPSW